MVGGGILTDKDARTRIFAGSLGLGLAGTIVGLNFAILKNLQPISRHATTMGLNWSVSGLIFFGIRESLLQDQKSKNDKLHLQFSQTRDYDELFSSVVSGILTGGAMGFLNRRKRSSVVSGALLFAAVAGLGQAVYTRLNRRRQDMIIQSMNEEPQVVEDGEESLIARARRAITKDPIERLPEWFPIRKIQSDEYRAMMEARKEEVEFELGEVRKTIAELDRREMALLQRLGIDSAK